MVTQLFRVSFEMFLELPLFTTFKINTSYRTFIGHTICGVPRATKKRGLIGLKIDAAFHLRVLHYRFRPRSIPSRNNK